jgi:hypothetical protein
MRGDTEPLHRGWETTLSNNRLPCYLVKVEGTNEIGRPTVTFYLVRADTQSAAIKAVEEVLPGTWGAVEASLTAIRRETVEALDLRPGAPRQI